MTTINYVITTDTKIDLLPTESIDAGRGNGRPGFFFFFAIRSSFSRPSYTILTVSLKETST